MPTVTIPLLAAIEAFGSVLPHTAAAREFTDVIKNVGVLLEGDDVVFVTTDRYTVGTYRINPDGRGDAPQPELPELQMIPAELAKWIATLKPRTLEMSGNPHGYYLQLTFDENVTAGVHWGALGDPENLPRAEVSRTAQAAKGNFPPVLRLFDGFKPGEVEKCILGGAHLAKFVTSMKVLGGEQTATFEHSQTTTGKPGPLRVTIGARFTGLLQPNLLLR